MIEQVKIFKNILCGNLLYSLSFVSHNGSVKILTSHIPRGAPLQIRLAVS